MHLFPRAFTLSSSNSTPSTDHVPSTPLRSTQKRKTLASGSSQSDSDSSTSSRKPSKRSRFSSLFTLGSFDFSIGETKPTTPIPIPSAPKGLKPYKPRNSLSSMGAMPKSPPTCTISFENATASQNQSSRVLTSLDVNAIPFPSTSPPSTNSEPSPNGKHTRSRSNHVLLRRSSSRTQSSSSKGHKRHRSCLSASELVPEGYERPSTPLPSSLYEHDDDEPCPRVDIPSLVDDYILSASLLKKRADAKLVAMVRRSVVSGLRESAVAALKATATPTSDSEPFDLSGHSFETISTLVGSGSSESGSGSVTYDFLNSSEADAALERKAEIMEQDRILVHRLGRYLDDWGYRERRIPPTIPSFHSGSYLTFLEGEADKENAQESTFLASMGDGDDADDDDPFLPMDVDEPDVTMQSEVTPPSSLCASAPLESPPARRSTPSPPPVIPISRAERTLALDQLVATLTLKHRDRIGARRTRPYEGEQRVRQGSKLKVELC